MHGIGTDEARTFVISAPVYFDIVQRRATEAAGKSAGLKFLRL